MKSVPDHMEHDADPNKPGFHIIAVLIPKSMTLIPPMWISADNDNSPDTTQIHIDYIQISPANDIIPDLMSSHDADPYPSRVRLLRMTNLRPVQGASQDPPFKFCLLQ